MILSMMRQAAGREDLCSICNMSGDFLLKAREVACSDNFLSSIVRRVTNSVQAGYSAGRQWATPNEWVRILPLIL